MPTINDHEFAAVTKLPAQARYEHFLKQIADWEEVWSLKTAECWALLGDQQGQEMVPVWPQERYAAACSVDDWKGSEPRSIPLAEWRKIWMPGIAQDGRLIAVFPTLDSKAAVVTAERLTADLDEELGNYE